VPAARGGGLRLATIRLWPYMIRVRVMNGNIRRYILGSFPLVSGSVSESEAS